jgi:hypothetical protein
VKFLREADLGWHQEIVRDANGREWSIMVEGNGKSVCRQFTVSLEHNVEITHEDFDDELRARRLGIQFGQTL